MNINNEAAEDENNDEASSSESQQNNSGEEIGQNHGMTGNNEEEEKEEEEGDVVVEVLPGADIAIDGAESRATVSSESEAMLVEGITSLPDGDQNRGAESDSKEGTAEIWDGNLHNQASNDDKKHTTVTERDVAEVQAIMDELVRKSGGSNNPSSGETAPQSLRDAGGWSRRKKRH